MQGNTPAHFAAAKGHLTLLAALLQVCPLLLLGSLPESHQHISAGSLLQSDPAPDVEACNAQGQSIQDLAAAAMDLGSDLSSDEAPSAAQPVFKRARKGQTLDGPEQERPSSADELDPESEWQARLREESGAELRGGDEEDWDR